MVDFFEIPDDIDAGVAARMERQQSLYRGDRRYNVVLGEQALHTNIGGPDKCARTCSPQPANSPTFRVGWPRQTRSTPSPNATSP
ncbi:MAG: Scr1 family TA system antitoxin-like transcriptional regulator [Pseudonocardiaceae bacterium]